jgi:phosphoribulokinase
MSKKHLIVAVTGSSGAGTTEVKLAFEHIFRSEGIKPAVIEGDSFHRYNRTEMDQAVTEAEAKGKSITHFGPEGNLFEELAGNIQNREQAKNAIIFTMKKKRPYMGIRLVHLLPGSPWKKILICYSMKVYMVASLQILLMLRNILTSL